MSSLFLILTFAAVAGALILIGRRKFDSAQFDIERLGAAALQAIGWIVLVLSGIVLSAWMVLWLVP